MRVRSAAIRCSSGAFAHAAAAKFPRSTTLGKNRQLPVAGSLGHRIQGMCNPSP